VKPPIFSKKRRNFLKFTTLFSLSGFLQTQFNLKAQAGGLIPFAFIKKKGDPFYSMVTLLIKGVGSNGSTSFIDQSKSQKTISPSGNAQISTSQFKFGNSSMYFDGVASLLNVPASADFNFGTGDFTIECWIKTSLKVNYQSIYIVFANNSNTAWLHTDSSGYFIYGTNGNVLNQSNTQVCDGVWHHVAISRELGTLRSFVDGVFKVSSSSPDDVAVSTTAGTIGSYGASRYFSGYMADLRITKGKARYINSFSLPESLPTN
jgi:hypothetical protein